jgi:hypothetical protein
MRWGALGACLLPLLGSSGLAASGADGHPAGGGEARAQLLLQIRPASRAGAQETDAGGAVRPAPAADLQGLRVVREDLALGDANLEPILTFEVSTSPGESTFHAGTRFEVHLRFSPLSAASPAAAEQILSAVLEESPDNSQRRRRGGDESSAVLRFYGLEGLGELGSMEPGRSVTFRVPLARLLDSASAAQRQAARAADGTWQLLVWAERHLGPATDRLPESGGDVLQVAEPPRP